MSTNAKIGWGATFKMGNPSTLLAIGELTAVSLPNSQTAEVEATHFGSPSRRREYIAGLIDDGEGTFEMNLDPGSTTDAAIRTALTDGLSRPYEIQIPTTTGTWKVTGSCIVRGYERRVPIDDRMTAVLTVRFTGAATEAVGP
jgi:hypothetical protein